MPDQHVCRLQVLSPCGSLSAVPLAEKKIHARILFRNLGKGRFEELIGGAGPGVDASFAVAGAFRDFDNDGDLDILIVNQNEPPSLLRNDISGLHHWIKVKLTGTRSNRSAIGARVTASYAGKCVAKAVLGQSSYLSVNDRRPALRSRFCHESRSACAMAVG